MRVAVLTNEKIAKTIHGFKVSVFPWNTERLDSLNLRDYDGVILDLGTYTPEFIDGHQLENVTITPKILYDILKTNPSFFITIGDPSTAIYHQDFLGAVGFTGTLVEGSGKSHHLTELGKKSIFSEYLNEITEYKYSYEHRFETDSEIVEEVTNSKYDSFTTLPVPLMQTKSGYSTAFRIQGKAWEKGYNNQEYSKYYIFDSMPVFLPAHPKGSKYAIEMSLRLQSESEAVGDSPGWVDQIVVHGQSEIDEEIGKKQDEIASLSSERDALLDKRAEVRRITEMLYLSEKPLETALKNTFTAYGYSIIEPESPEHVEFYLVHGNLEFVVEIKSTVKEQFNKDGLRQVVEWKDNEALENGKEYKPLLILSNEFSKPLEERNSDVLDANLLTFAASRGVAVITVPVLYEGLQLIAKGRITKDNMINILHNKNGIIQSEDLIPASQEA